MVNEVKINSSSLTFDVHLPINEFVWYEAQIDDSENYSEICQSIVECHNGLDEALASVQEYLAYITETFSEVDLEISKVMNEGGARLASHSHNVAHTMER